MTELDAALAIMSRGEDDDGYGDEEETTLPYAVYLSGRNPAYAMTEDALLAWMNEERERTTMEPSEYVGLTFGKLTVKATLEAKSGPLGVCQCACGGTVNIRLRRLHALEVTSCGVCDSKEAA